MKVKIIPQNMAFYSNIFRSLNVKQIIPVAERLLIISGRHIHSNVGNTIEISSVHGNHLSSAENGVACATYKLTKNVGEKLKHTLIEEDESTSVRIVPSRKPIPLPQDDLTNTILRKNYSHPI